MSIHLNLSWSIKLLVVKVEYLAELQFIKSTTWDLTRRALCSLCRKWKKKRSPTPWFRTTVTGCFRMQWMKFGQQAEASEPYHLLLLFLKPTFWHPFNLQMIFSLLILNGEAEEILRCLTILGVVKCSCLSALNKSLHLSCSLWISISYFFFGALKAGRLKFPPRSLVMVSPSHSWNRFRRCRADILSSSCLCCIHLTKIKRGCLCQRRVQPVAAHFSLFRE